MGIGDKFKEERIRQGYSLDEVEEDTKIRKYYLEAIENDNYIVLPPKVYAVGFVKRYAKFLGLNEHECSEEFKKLAYGSESSESIENIIIDKPTKITNVESSISWKNVLVALAFLAVVIWAGDYLITYFTKDHNLPPNHGNQPIVEQPRQVEEDENVIDENKVENEQPTGVEVIIQASQNCWLNVIVDDVPEYNATLAAGESLTFTGTDKIYLKAGNAGGITITYNGEEMPTLGQHGEVKEATYISY